MMMKWLFGILVLSNIFIAMWGKWYELPASMPPALPAEINVGDLQLLNEPGVSPKPINQTATVAEKPEEPDQSVAAETSETKPPAPLKPVNICYSLGPFGKTNEIADTVLRVKQDVLRFSQRSVGRQSIAGYRVYLPPLKSSKAAEQIKTKLAKKGYNDLYVIQNGKYKNGLALGFFLVRKNAVERVQKVRQDGIKAMIEPVKREHALYWLDLEVEPAASNRMENLEWNTGVKLTRKDCPETAQAAKN